MQVDWLHTVLGLVAFAWMVIGSLVIRKNARLGAILGAVINGVEQADNQTVKDTIKRVAMADGVQDHLAAIVKVETGDLKP